jgi:outer membrane protein assembly factor BamB
LAKSAWPKIHQGALNGGLGLGKGAKGTLAWSFTPLGYPNTGITVGPDGVCYFETAGGYQCAYNPDGSQKWVTKISSGSTANTGSNAAVGPDGTIYVNDTTLSAYTPDGGVKWKSQYGGGANQQPVIGSDGTIYVGTYFETSGLAAINPDGTLKWAFSGVGAASSSPAIGPDGTIYVACSDNKLHAISPSGTELWAFTMGLTLSGSKPALGSDGTIYITTGANQQGSSANIAGFYAVNPDGTSKWSYSVPNTIISSETLGADGTIYIGTNYGNLFALNSDGSTKWQADFGATIWSIMIDPSGTVYVLVAAGGNSVLFAYNADGTLKWRYNALNQYLIYAQMVNGNICLAGQSSLLSDVGPNGVPISTTELFIHVTSSPVLAIDNTIYVGADDGYLHAINPDGSLKWKFATKGVITSSPAIASDGTIYAVTSEGSCYAVASTGTLKWNVSVGWIGQSSPTIGPDGTVYVASAYGVYAINPGGTIKWTCDSVGSTESAPAISADGTLYITTIDDYGNTYLNAVNSVGTLKWKVNIGNAYDWATKLNPSVDPVIGQDGTIYVFSGMNLTVFTPSGSVKWTYPLGPNGGTNPCIGPDGTIYVGSNTANNIDPSCILALNSDGSLKWQYADLAGRYEGDLSVGADGTVYAQPYLSGQAYQSGLIEAINSKGVLKWGLKLPMLLWPYVCSPTIGADGTIYIGGPSLFAIK